jgi:hypothetical protein
MEILLNQPTTTASIGCRKLSAVSRTDEVNKVRTNV